MDKVIFIDRDGVINIDLIGDYIKTWDEFHFELGAEEALKRLNDAGYKIIIISNQAGIGDGIFKEEALWDLHQKMIEALNKQDIVIHDTFYCLHGKQEGCKCRKPEVGLFEKALTSADFDREKTFFIGDKATDIEAGLRFGLKTIFVLTGHGPYDKEKLTDTIKPNLMAENLLEATQLLLTQDELTKG